MMINDCCDEQSNDEVYWLVMVGEWGAQFTGGKKYSSNRRRPSFVRECRIWLLVCITIINVIMRSCTENDVIHDDDCDDDDRGIWFVLSREVKWIKFHSDTKLFGLLFKFFLFFCTVSAVLVVVDDDRVRLEFIAELIAMGDNYAPILFCLLGLKLSQ